MNEFYELLEKNQNPNHPLHLSASSISLHIRCPRQWADKYLHGRRGPSNSALIIGSAFHLATSRLFMGEPVGDYWGEVVSKETNNIPINGNIVWKDDPSKAKNIAANHVYHYWEAVGKHLDVVRAEAEYLFELDGVDLPILAIVDAETEEDVIDLKTTGYFNRKQVRPNKEWKFQQGIYQIHLGKPAQIHVITRAKEDPIVVPTSEAHPLYFGMIDTVKVADTVRAEWKRILHHWEDYGLRPWPGNITHEWGGKYCSVPDCCAL